MTVSEKMILRLEAWQRKNKKTEAVLFSAAWLMFYLLRVLNRSVFVSSSLDMLLRIGLYVWFISLMAWLVLLLNPYFADYLRRRHAGASLEEAMLFEAKRPTTGSVWSDAAVFLLIVIAGVGFIGYFLYQMSIVGKR